MLLTAIVDLRVTAGKAARRAPDRYSTSAPREPPEVRSPGRMRVHLTSHQLQHTGTRLSAKAGLGRSDSCQLARGSFNKV